MSDSESHEVSHHHDEPEYYQKKKKRKEGEKEKKNLLDHRDHSITALFYYLMVLNKNKLFQFRGCKAQIKKDQQQQKSKYNRVDKNVSLLP